MVAVIYLPLESQFIDVSPFGAWCICKIKRCIWEMMPFPDGTADKLPEFTYKFPF
jgi:hypothetical protein